MDLLSIIIYAICGRMEKPMRKYENLNCVSENRVPQRAYYIPQSGCTMLNGIWDFKFFDCDFEEAFQNGVIGLMTAIEKYDITIISGISNFL